MDGVFANEANFMSKFNQELKNLINSPKYFEEFKFKPSFELFLNKDSQNVLKQTLLLLHREKELV